MSAWTSIEAELVNRLIDSDLDIPPTDAERLESHHDGKRCFLTGLTPSRGVLEWTHLIPGCVGVRECEGEIGESYLCLPRLHSLSRFGVATHHHCRKTDVDDI